MNKKEPTSLDTMNGSWYDEPAGSNLLRLPAAFVQDDGNSESNNTYAGSMPTLVYSLVWDFLLESDGNSISEEGYFIDLKSVSSFMLVSKTATDEFHACHGWSQCVLALKQEAASKQQVITVYQETGVKLATTDNPLTPLDPDELKACRSFLAKADDIRKVDTRLVRIKMVLLPKASLLASRTAHAGNRISSLFVYTSSLEQSIRAVERLVNIQPALLHILGMLRDLINLDENDG